ncbi:hypothetical protein J1614_005052 [Plenodomus biglobosus]|nr:hypothetical protein J1614_005052 [Plenodomus biglobosus]
MDTRFDSDVRAPYNASRFPERLSTTLLSTRRLADPPVSNKLFESRESHAVGAGQPRDFG